LCVFCLISFHEKLTVKQPRYGSHYVWLTAFLLVATLGFSLRGSLLLAQTAEDDGESAAAAKWPEPKIDEGQKSNYFKVMEILRKGKFDSPEEKKLFTDYYTKYALPRWVTQNYMARLPWKKGKEDRTNDVVRDLRRELQTAAKNPEFYKQFATFVLDYFTTHVLDEKGSPPVSQYNVMVIIGEMDLPQVPLLLVKTVKAQDSRDFLKVAALIGLIEQATKPALANPETKKAVTDAMVALVAAPQPTDKRADGVAWMRGQAAQVLGLLKSPGKNGAVAEALRKMVDDTSLPLSQRVIAANALGQLDYSGENVAGAPYLASLIGLTRDVLAAEEHPSRRRLRGNLKYLLTALRGEDAQRKGIAGLVKTPADQKTVKTLSDSLDKLYTSMDNSDLEDQDVPDKIDEVQSNLKPVLKKKSP